MNWIVAVELGDAPSDQRRVPVDVSDPKYAKLF
jgi:hypothetical protein